MHEIISPKISYSDNTFGTTKRIRAVQRREPKALYVADLCLKTRTGDWTSCPYSVFYVEEPRIGYKNRYFGIGFDFFGKVFISDANSVGFDSNGTLWPAIRRAKDGSVLFSQWRHNFKDDSDGAVDGGQDYFKLVGGTTKDDLIYIGLVGGKWVVNPHLPPSTSTS